MSTPAPRVPPDVIDALLDHDSCAAIIAAADASGFGPASRGDAGGPRIESAGGQASDSAVAQLDDARLALRLYLKLDGHLPEELDGRRLSRVGSTMQVVRYRAGERTPAHADPQHTLRPEPGAHGQAATSELTVLVHLGEDFEGGATEFDDGPAVTAQTGRAVVFDRAHRHRGAPVERGTKHVLRCHVFYEDED